MLKDIKEFYEKTKFVFNGKEELDPNFEWPFTWVKIFYKVYPRFPRKKLNLTKNNSTLNELLEARESIREFDPNSSLSFEEFSTLIYYSIGLKNRDSDKPEQAKRMYPSAGQRYPIEAYIISHNVANLDEGIYHYNVKNNEFEILLKRDLRKEMRKILNSDMGENSAALLVLGAALGRTEVKYGINAYRFALLEAGHIGQNVYLQCQNLDIGCCAIGGFDNDKLTKLMDLIEEEIPLYILAVGPKK